MFANYSPSNVFFRRWYSRMFIVDALGWPGNALWTLRLLIKPILLVDHKCQCIPY